MSSHKKKSGKRRVIKRTKITPGKAASGEPSWVEPFLAYLRKGHSVQRAAEALKMDRSGIYKYKKRNDKFAKRWAEAITIVIDDLEEAALSRAIHGWLEPVFYKGDEIGTVRRFSNVLTIFLLKTRRPEVYNIEVGATSTGNSSPHEAAGAIRDALKEMDASVGG